MQKVSNQLVLTGYLVSHTLTLNLHLDLDLNETSFSHELRMHYACHIISPVCKFRDLPNGPHVLLPQCP